MRGNSITAAPHKTAIQKMNKILTIACLMTVAVMAASCDRIDNKAVPNYTVRLNLGTYALWNTYGVKGVGDYQFFNRDKGIPGNFPYNVNTYTGFGGVLLVMGLNSGSSSYMPLAFDAACPVESNANVTVSIDPKNFDAFCPQCGSRYNVVTGAGGPTSGEAVKKKVGLRTYVVRQSTNGGYIITSY